MKLELVNEPLKVTQTAIVADLEDTMVTLGKRTKIFPVVETHSFETIGYYITGDIYLGSDTIINTDKGAIGDPTEKLSKKAFLKHEDLDFNNTKSDELSDRDFRKIEVEAYRYFEKMYRSQKNSHRKFIANNKKYRWPDELDDLDFYIYLFEPEEFVLIKDNQSIISLSKDSSEVIICDKKKNSYVEVSKEDGVKVSTKKGEIVKTSNTGVIINGKNLNEIISNALHPLSGMFNHKRKF